MVKVNLSLVEADKSLNIDSIAERLQKICGLKIVINENIFLMNSYYDANRGQYNAAGIVDNYPVSEKEEKNIILTNVDIFIPIFTYLFGLAQFEKNNAVVSSYRLDNKFYGLPENLEMLENRTVKEIIHELGHTFGLIHCQDYHCVMYSSVTVDDLDSKSENFCESCGKNISH